MKFNNRKKPFLIAEIGINHNGSIEISKKLIDLAKKYEFDAVKFQKRDLKIVVPEKQKNIVRTTPWGEMTYFNYKKKIEFGYKEYKQIDNYCKKLKIKWFASPWDIKSSSFLKKFKLKYNKVASAMITNIELIENIAKQKKTTFISTGMSTLEEIDKVVDIFKKKNCPFELMHCNSSYPMPENDANIRCIVTLKKRYNCDVGYSGH